MNFKPPQQQSKSSNEFHGETGTEPGEKIFISIICLKPRNRLRCSHDCGMTWVIVNLIHDKATQRNWMDRAGGGGG